MILDRWNWNVDQILNYIRFDLIDDDDEIVKRFDDAIRNKDFGFRIDDLNYWLKNISSENIRRLLLLYTKNKYDIKNNLKRKIANELEYISADQNLSADMDQALQNSKNSKEFIKIEINDLSLNPQSDPAS